MSIDRILTIVGSSCQATEPAVAANATPPVLVIDQIDLLPVATTLHQHPECYFDMLSCITAIDNGPGGMMELIYNLYSIPHNIHLGIRIMTSRENPVVDSLSLLWKTADWHEREAYDMFGIQFRNHPDLRRILMPADWNGYPLRKDYVNPEYYRDIKIEY